MLVLSRRSLESIQIGDGITIKVLGIKGNVVSLGIKAPGDVRIVRAELVPEDDTPAEPERENSAA